MDGWDLSVLRKEGTPPKLMLLFFFFSSSASMISLALMELSGWLYGVGEAITGTVNAIL